MILNLPAVRIHKITDTCVDDREKVLEEVQEYKKTENDWIEWKILEVKDFQDLYNYYM